MKGINLSKSDYKILQTIQTRIKLSRNRALQTVNFELINLYRDIGEIVSKRKKNSLHTNYFVAELSQDIQQRNPGIKGFSKTNLFNMVRFYEKYKPYSFVQTLSGQISWSHNVLIMNRCETLEEARYYMESTIKYGWSYNILLNKLGFDEFHSLSRSQHNLNSAQEGAVNELVVKDEYVFDFLELNDEYTEHELEKKILHNLEKFLLEMGNRFLFAGRQYRIEVGEKEYFIDILLYHRLLRCFVAVELKVGEFKPEYVGKMSFYLGVLDKTVKTQNENKSIGIIVCKEKDRALVEYSLSDTSKPMAVATYRNHSTLPKKYASELPDEKAIQALLS